MQGVALPDDKVSPICTAPRNILAPTAQEEDLLEIGGHKLDGILGLDTRVLGCPLGFLREAVDLGVALNGETHENAGLGQRADRAFRQRRPHWSEARVPLGWPGLLGPSPLRVHE